MLVQPTNPSGRLCPSLSLCEAQQNLYLHLSQMYIPALELRHRTLPVLKPRLGQTHTHVPLQSTTSPPSAYLGPLSRSTTDPPPSFPWAAVGKPSGSGARSWILFFEGGGWCAGVDTAVGGFDACAARARVGRGPGRAAVQQNCTSNPRPTLFTSWLQLQRCLKQ